MLDTGTLKVAKRAEFPEGSKPWMLRVSPEGKEDPRPAHQPINTLS